MTTDASGNVFVFDQRTVRRIDAVTGVIQTVVGSIYRGVPTQGQSALAPTFLDDAAEDAVVTPTGQVHLLSADQLWRVEDGRLRWLATGPFRGIDAGPDGTVFVNGGSSGVFALAPGTSTLARWSEGSFDSVRAGAPGQAYGRTAAGIWRLTSQGRELVAGGGTAGPSGGARALDLNLREPAGVDFDVLPDGQLVIGRHEGHGTGFACSTWRTHANGTVSAVATVGVRLCRPAAAGTDVLLLSNDAIVRFAADGSEATTTGRPYAGGVGSSPDGTPAARAFSRGMADLHRDADGRLLFRTAAQVRGINAAGGLHAVRPSGRGSRLDRPDAGG